MGLDRRRFLGLAAAGAATLLRPPAWRAGTTTPRRVLVLGAGLAGLSAAWKLREAGVEVVILEAQRRPGGRVLTLREPFSDGLYAEAGAGRIPETHALTLEYVRLFGLELDPFYPPSGKQVLRWRGARIAYASTGDIDMASAPLELTPEERRLGLDGVDEKYVGGTMRRLGDLEAADWPPADVAPIDRLPFGEYLARGGASPDAAAYLALGFERWSALDALREATNHHTKTLSKIRGGNDLLPRAFAARLSDILRYGSPVVAIRQDASGVEAVVAPLSGGQEAVRADAMICAIPFTVLRSIPVSPEWPSEKRRAIDTLSTGCVLRVELQTRRRFWEGRGENGFATVDQPLEIWSPTWNQPGRRGILQLYVYEDLARKVCAGSEAERVRFGLDVVEPVHPGLAEQYEGGVAKCWDEDPWARGAYTLHRPGELTNGLPALIERPVGRIHFAGEHASPYPGWMQGAIWSGHRAAAAVLRA